MIEKLESANNRSAQAREEMEALRKELESAAARCSKQSDQLEEMKLAANDAAEKLRQQSDAKLLSMSTSYERDVKTAVEQAVRSARRTWRHELHEKVDALEQELHVQEESFKEALA